MSRFNHEAYEKIYPRTVEAPAPESVVSTFRPTQDKLEGKDPDVADQPVKQDTVKPAAPIIEDIPDEPEGGDGDGHAEHSKPDSE